MRLKIALCDDDTNTLKITEKLISNYNVRFDQDFTTFLFDNGQSLIESFHEKGTYDIIFLDVEMPITNGIETARKIRTNIDRNVTIVFLSNFPKYMQDSLEVHPYHYIQKPITSEKINDLLSNILEDIKEKCLLFTLIATDYSEKSININDIVYIETTNAKKELICFHLIDQEIETKGLISYWEQLLSSYGFYTCYRGLLINISHIRIIDKLSVILDNGTSLPVSRNATKKLKDLYFNQIIKVKR